MFIAFEGLDASGKTTAQRGVAEELRRAGHSVFETRAPGEGEVGGAIRQLVLEGEDLSPWTETHLFLADRAYHVRRFIRPALEKGQIVLCDRFSGSTVAYQGAGRGLGVEKIAAMCNDAATGLWPDVTVLLDADPEALAERRTDGDRLDQEALDFRRVVRDAFLEQASSGGWSVVDATQEAETVRDECLAAVLPRLAP